jgi:L-lactate permease
MLVPEFSLLFSLLLIFMIFSLRKIAAILSYISYLFFSILNIYHVLSKFFGEELKNVLKYIIPSIAKWQNEIL